MKTNKLAAGALALVLGLGAVTPAFAEGTEVPEEKSVITEEFRDARARYAKALTNINTLETNTKAAEEAVEEANKALADKVLARSRAEAAKEKELEELKAEINKFAENGEEPNPTVEKSLMDKRENVESEHNKIIEEAKKAEAEAQEALDNAVEALNKAREEKIEDKSLEEWETEKEAARGDLVDQGALLKTLDLAEKYGDATLVKPAEKPAEPTDEGEDADTDAKEAIEAAEAALYNAKVTKSAAELLLNKTPETVKPIEDELVKLLAEQEEKIEALNKALDAAKGESVALSDILFSTAYAAEGEEESDPIAELKKATDDLNENTNAINELLEENEANIREANEEAENGADDKNEPADTDNKNEPADKDDKTNADVNKSDENEKEPAEKTETKTEVKTVKKPAKNAKTGVVGVAGVAGVLAAASVAYAASKKNN